MKGESFTRIYFDSATGLSNLSTTFFQNITISDKKIQAVMNTRPRLRVDDAKILLQLAREQKGDSPWTSLVLTSLARLLLHAAEPLENFIKPNEGLLYRSIVEYNEYFANVLAAPHPRFPNDYVHKLPACPAHQDTSYKEEVTQKGLEPLYANGRNLDFFELGIWISMNPYRVLPSFLTVRQRTYRKAILFDVGANGFLGSPKSLIDMYAPFLKFDEAHLFEPDSKGMHIPKYYATHYDIRFHQISVKVGTRDESDILTWIRKLTTEDDFVVLKFDVDEIGEDITMEWGFLADLIASQEFRLIDELHIELHFFVPHIWFTWTHSMKQAFDVLRQLRACGVAVHAWP
jgi:hypothetical protein